MNDLPDSIASTEQLEEMLSEPLPGVVETMAKLDGDLIVLGVGGKMGPTLARMARRATDLAGVRRRVIGVARFSNPAERAKLEACGVETVTCDLLQRDRVSELPDVPNVVFMAGMKFGTTNQEAMTWAMNVYVPAIVCDKYAKSRIAAFSTGNVYGLSPMEKGGSVESDPLNPTGDYACSCAGRERMFEHFSRTQGTPVTIIRLNYACEMRYGVLADLARRVWTGEPVDVSMSCVNVIWQRDANAMSLESLAHAASPPFLLNVAGPEQLRVRQIAEQFGILMKRPVSFTGREATDALLSNGQLGYRLFGKPTVTPEIMMKWIADWIMRGGESLNKPTHFETRDGKF